ncbi:MAG: hypothetical protein GY720_00805 [bacterium]|nr:hypothetical protein [bacterium]
MKSTEAYSILTAAGHMQPVSVDVVARLLGLSNAEASDVLGRMVKMQLATRVRRGLYLLKPATEIGTPTLGVDAYRAAIAITDPSPAYIGFYTALHHHALVVRPATTVYVASAVRRRSRTIGGVPVRFVTVRPDRLFGTTLEDGVPWSDLERTLVDAVNRPQYCGEMDTVIGAFHRSADVLRVDKLTSYLRRLNVSSVTRRTQYIMSRLGLTQDGAGPSPAKKHRRYSPLDPARPNEGQPVPKYELIDNVAASVWHGP